MSDLQSEKSQESSSKIKTPSKRTPSKRLSNIERAQLESVEVIKNMGGSLDVEGGRRTRSSVRGNSTPTTPATPPPAKKSRQSSSAAPRRGRGNKLLIHDGCGDNEVKDVSLVDGIKKIPEKINDDSKKDESTVVKHDTIAEKSDKLDEELSDGTENLNDNSKKVEETISKIVPSTEEISEKSEVDASSDLEIIHENHIEEEKNELLSTPEVVVTAPTPEKQQSTNNVPEKKLDPVEPMEVDSSMIEENDKSISASISTTDETSVQQSAIPTTNNCTSSTTDKTIIENNLIKNKEADDVQVVDTNKIEKSTGEITNKKSVIQCNNVANDQVNDEKATIIPPNDIINSTMENDKEQQPSTEIKIVAESDDKKGNDSCEPKISSPTPSEGITQPQTCN